MTLWLKRYLSLFFDFEYFGILNLLAIPLLIYFLVTIKKRKRWEIALAFVLIISCFFLEIRGGHWYRYLLTLYPFSLGVIFLLGWELIKNKSRSLKIGIFIILGTAVFFNYYHFRETYKFWWKYKVTLENLQFPYERLEYINKTKDMNSNDTVLVCSHRYLFFYYTNKKGIHYGDSRFEIFNRQKSKEAALDVLKNQLKVKYIFRNWNFRPHGFLNDIITNDCDLIIKDNSGYLYKIRENTDKEVVNKKTNENIKIY